MATAIGHTIGALRVVIGADTTALKRGLGEAGSGLTKLRGMAAPAAAAIAAIGAAATAAAAGMVSMARAEMNVIDTQAKLSRSLGGTVTGLRALQLAAEDAGIDGLDASLNRLNRRLGAVEMGGGPAVETVKRLGLNLAELAEMDVDERLATIADAIRDYGGSAQESARHLQQLGFEQRGATELFIAGGDAIRAAREQVQDYGLAVSEVDIGRIEAANEVFDRISRLTAGLKTQLAVELAPVLQATAGLFLDTARAAGGIGPSVRDGVDIAVRSLAFVIDAIDGVTRTFQIAGRGAAVFALATEAGVWQLADAITAGPVAAIVKLIETMNRLPFVDIDTRGLTGFSDGIRQRMEEARAAVREGVSDIKSILEAPMASQALLARIEAARAAAPRTSPTLSLGGTPGTPVTGSTATTEGDAGEEERRRLAAERAKALAEELAQIRTHLATRAELETQAATERLEMLKTLANEGVIAESESRQMAIGVAEKFYAAMKGLRAQDYEASKRAMEDDRALGLLSNSEHFRARLDAALAHEEAMTKLAIDSFQLRRDQLDALRDEGGLLDAEYRDAIEELERTHQDELTHIAAKGAKDRDDLAQEEARKRLAVFGAMSANLTQLMNSGHREMFRIGKIAAVAGALLQGRSAVVSAYAKGTEIGGPPLGAAFAATAAAATAAQIAAVASTSFGGSGSVSAPGGGGTRPTDQLPDPPIGGADPATERRAVTITLQGELFNRQQVRDLIEQINEATADGAVLRLS